MPFAAALPAIIGAGTSLAGGLAGLGNKRPPSLDATQSRILDALLNQLYPQVGQTPTIDPVQKSLMFGQLAQGAKGGENRVTNALVSRGLGRSGLLGSALTQNSNQLQAGQTQVLSYLQQQAVDQRNDTIKQILGLLGVENYPEQSGFGAFMSGMAPALADQIGFQQQKSFLEKLYGV